MRTRVHNQGDFLEQKIAYLHKQHKVTFKLRVKEDRRNVTSKGKSDYSRAENVNDLRGGILGFFFLIVAAKN